MSSRLDTPIKLKKFDIAPAAVQAYFALSEKHKEVLYLRQVANMSLENTGRMMSVTRERVRQYEAEALRAMTVIIRENAEIKEEVTDL